MGARDLSAMRMAFKLFTAEQRANLREHAAAMTPIFCGIEDAQRVADFTAGRVVKG